MATKNNIFEKIYARPTQLIMQFIRTQGGALNLLRKSIFIYKSEGLKGLLYRIKKATHSYLSGPVPGSFGMDRNDYEAWISNFEEKNTPNKSQIAKEINKMSLHPTISIIMPTYNSNHKWLTEAIYSVTNQSYPHWELCIADDASTDPEVRNIINKFSLNDKRIKKIFRSTNGHISLATNSGLEISNGSWITFLDHDDLLSINALYHIAKTITENSSVKIIYSDEDKINENKRHTPHFKTNWNPDILYSYNYICHLVAYKKDLLTEIGGLRIGFEGAQDYDLILRCIEKVDEHEIYHIPHILYHWRTHPESTSAGSNTKPYANSARTRALNEHFNRENIKAKVEPQEGIQRVKFLHEQPNPLVSLIIPTKNNKYLLENCIKSILNKTTYNNYEIIIVNNGSTEIETLKYLNEISNLEKIKIITDNRDFNYSAINNNAANNAKGDIIGLINDDIEVISPDWLSEMVSHALRPGIGAVGAKLFYKNNTIQHAGVILGICGIAGHAYRGLPKHHSGHHSRAIVTSRVSAVTAACLIIKKCVYEHASGLNEKDLPVAFNDVDLCLKIKKLGYHNILTPHAKLYHYESASRGHDNSGAKIRRHLKEIEYMRATWGDELLNDPYYNKNLTLDYEDFSLNWNNTRSI